MVLGLHAVDGGGARRAPAPRDAGDLAAGRDMVSASTALYEFTCEPASVALYGAALLLQLLCGSGYST